MPSTLSKSGCCCRCRCFSLFLLREIPFGSDGDFSQSALITRINSELANDYGNLLNRTLGMLKKYRKSVLPQEVSPKDPSWSDLEQQLITTVAEARQELVKQMKVYRFHDALRAIWTAVSAGNKYVDSCAPWTLAKAGEKKAKDLDRVLYNLIELLRVIGVWTLPFCHRKPKSCSGRLRLMKVLGLLNILQWKLGGA